MSRLEQARTLIRSAAVRPFEGFWYDTDAGTTRRGSIGAEQLARSLAYVIDLKPRKGTGAVGGSRLGGHPDLPADLPGGWRPELPFYAQLSLDDLAPLDLDERLPREGLIHVFQDRGEGRCELAYRASPGALVRRTDLEPLESEARPLTFAPRLVIYANEGDAYDYAAGLAAIPADVRAGIEELYGCPFGRRDTELRLFGRPVTWQGEDDEMDDGEDFGDEDEIVDDEPPSAAVLLLHFTLDDASLQIWVDRSDLRRGRLDGAWETFSTT